LEVSVVTNILGEDASFLLYHFSLFQAHCMDRTLAYGCNRLIRMHVVTSG
jgi:hypothetical protein